VKQVVKIYTEINTSYIPDEDTTIIWQDMYKYTEGEGDELIQRAVIGWYHGAPEDRYTDYFSKSSLIANYIDCEN
jgi:hypothetical protein